MFVVLTVIVGTICRPSASVNAFLGSSVVHSKVPVLFRPSKKLFLFDFLGELPKTTSLNLVSPVGGIYLLEIVLEHKTVLFSRSVSSQHLWKWLTHVVVHNRSKSKVTHQPSQCKTESYATPENDRIPSPPLKLVLFASLSNLPGFNPWFFVSEVVSILKMALPLLNLLAS